IGGLHHRASFPPSAAPWCLVAPCTGAHSAIPHWTSTTVRPTGARLRVRCLRARGSIGAPSETADFKRSNGTGFDSPRTGHRSSNRSVCFRNLLAACTGAVYPIPAEHTEAATYPVLTPGVGAEETAAARRAYWVSTRINSLMFGTPIPVTMS